MIDERFREDGHFHGDGMFGYVYRSTTRPRLSFKETCYRKTRTTERVWKVDGLDIGSREQAEAALLVPPVLTDDEQDAADRLSDDWMGREEQRAIGITTLVMLGEKGIAEWEAGKVRRRHSDNVGQVDSLSGEHVRTIAEELNTSVRYE